MKKLIVLVMIALFAWSLNMSAQDKTKKETKTTTKSTTTQTQAKTNDKPSQGDKVVAGKKGPGGEAVYQGSQGGEYYMNKNGNKTYLKNTDKAVANKKGPNGEAVYVGPKGGEYYMNKNGEKVYLSKDKK